VPNKINKIKIKIDKSSGVSGGVSKGGWGICLAHVCELVRWVVLLFINIKLVKYLNRAANLG